MRACGKWLLRQLQRLSFDSHSCKPAFSLRDNKFSQGLFFKNTAGPKCRPTFQIKVTIGGVTMFSVRLVVCFGTSFTKIILRRNVGIFLFSLVVAYQNLFSLQKCCSSPAKNAIDHKRSRNRRGNCFISCAQQYKCSRYLIDARNSFVSAIRDLHLAMQFSIHLPQVCDSFTKHWLSLNFCRCFCLE
jgi:hypothetical protein